MTEILYDSETSVVSEQFAIVYAPRRSRKRFAENCVTIVDSVKAAIEQSQTDNKQYAAKVLGPSRSSEGLMLYYLVDWLTDDTPG
jgi:hypothetical protein